MFNELESSKPYRSFDPDFAGDSDIEQIIEKLILKRKEENYLDFKLTGYDLKDDKSKDELCKDIVAMANLLNHETSTKEAYLVLGVADPKEQGKAYHPSKKPPFEPPQKDQEGQFEDSLQQIINSYTRPKVHISYKTIRSKLNLESESKTRIGLITIYRPSKFPIFVEGGKNKGKAFVRAGKTTDVLQGHDIVEWIKDQSQSNFFDQLTSAKPRKRLSALEYILEQEPDERRYKYIAQLIYGFLHDPSEEVGITAIKSLGQFKDDNNINHLISFCEKKIIDRANTNKESTYRYISSIAEALSNFESNDIIRELIRLSNILEDESSEEWHSIISILRDTAQKINSQLIANNTTNHLLIDSE